jgi:RND family efflux transporter MFP subunit
MEAEAGVRQAKKRVEESRIALGYTRILAPEDGEVVRRLAEPGDLAWPGKPLLVIQTREALRLEALVREGLIHRVSVGTLLKVSISALNKEFSGAVEELVPSADPQTRTFLVKVGLPLVEGLYPGMFGRLLVPVKETSIVVVPAAAVQRIGQLEVVTARTNGKWQRYFVKTGRRRGPMVEILSGLNGGEILAMEEEPDA